MIAVVIDIALVAILIVSGFRGFRNGAVRGICGFLAIILSLVLANAAAKSFSDEFTEALSPFVGGLVDSKVQSILSPDDKDDKEEERPEYYDDYDTSTTHGMAMLTLRQLGFLEPLAEKMTAAIEEETSKIGYALGEVITQKLCSGISHVAVFVVIFILLSIIFAVVGNLLHVVFSLPGLRLLDQIAGTALGLLRGLVIVMFISLIFRYFGMVGSNIVEETAVLEYFVRHNAVANVLGI